MSNGANILRLLGWILFIVGLVWAGFNLYYLVQNLDHMFLIGFSYGNILVSIALIYIGFRLTGYRSRRDIE